LIPSISPFELGWTEIAAGGVAAKGVAEALDVVEDGHLGGVASREARAVAELFLQAGEEGLDHGIVLAVSLAARAAGAVLAGEGILVGLAGVLAAAIRADLYVELGTTLPQGSLEGFLHQAGR